MIILLKVQVCMNLLPENGPFLSFTYTCLDGNCLGRTPVLLNELQAL